MTKENTEFSKYERTRILGARALQISMDAPLLIKMEGEELENLYYDPLKIAQRELDSGVLPITVNRPMPLKRDEKLKELKIEEIEKEDKEKIEESEEDSSISDVKAAAEEIPNLKSEEEIDEEMEGEGIDGASDSDSESYE